MGHGCPQPIEIFGVNELVHRLYAFSGFAGGQVQYAHRFFRPCHVAARGDVEDPVTCMTRSLRTFQEVFAELQVELNLLLRSDIVTDTDKSDDVSTTVTQRYF